MNKAKTGTRPRNGFGLVGVPHPPHMRTGLSNGDLSGRAFRASARAEEMSDVDKPRDIDCLRAALAHDEAATAHQLAGNGTRAVAHTREADRWREIRDELQLVRRTNATMLAGRLLVAALLFGAAAFFVFAMYYAGRH